MLKREIEKQVSRRERCVTYMSKAYNFPQAPICLKMEEKQ